MDKELNVHFLDIYVKNGLNHYKVDCSWKVN